MREKTRFAVDFFKTYPFFTRATGHTVEAILTLDSSYDVFSQPLVSFGVSTISEHF